MCTQSDNNCCLCRSCSGLYQLSVTCYIWEAYPYDTHVYRSWMLAQPTLQKTCLMPSATTSSMQPMEEILGNHFSTLPLHIIVFENYLVTMLVSKLGMYDSNGCSTMHAGQPSLSSASAPNLNWTSVCGIHNFSAMLATSRRMVLYWATLQM